MKEPKLTLRIPYQLNEQVELTRLQLDEQTIRPFIGGAAPSIIIDGVTEDGAGWVFCGGEITICPPRDHNCRAAGLAAALGYHSSLVRLGMRGDILVFGIDRETQDRMDIPTPLLNVARILFVTGIVDVHPTLSARGAPIRLVDWMDRF